MTIYQGFCAWICGNNGKYYTELALKLLMVYLGSWRNKCTVPVEHARNIDGGMHGAMGCSVERGVGAQKPQWSGEGKSMI